MNYSEVALLLLAVLNGWLAIKYNYTFNAFVTGVLISDLIRFVANH